ncbi:MAG: hypothetical protein QHJ82_05435 [Verrucomicrobiota bacterium]|nr:hypothetical protein [Verrucomicrobiota bacterium]
MNKNTILTAARQLLFPREFRIRAPVWPGDWLETLEKVARTPTQHPPNPDDNERIKFLADLATGVWRLKQKMIEPGTDRPKEQFKREYRHLESVWDLLVQAGLQIQDHTGKPFDSGQALRVLAFQPTPGIKRERVQETIKPTVYFRGRHVQMGEVIVQSPIKGDGGGSAPANASGNLNADSRPSGGAVG